MEFTSVYYEKTLEDATKRLSKLRKTDRFVELKAYVLKEGNKYRVLRKIDLSKEKK